MVDRLVADLGVLQHLLDLGLVLPDERDRDAAVRADLPRPGNEPRRRCPPAARSRSDRIACSDAKKETTPPHFKRRSPAGVALRLRSATVRSASTAMSMSSSLVSKPHEKRSVPSGAVPRLRCAAGEQCRPARVITPHSSSIRRATVAQGMPSRFSETIPTLSPGSAGP